MTRKEKIFKALSKKHILSVLQYIYANQPIGFNTLCSDLPCFCSATIRKATNSLSACGLIESIYLNDPNDKRKRGFIIKDKSSVDTIINFIQD